MKWVDIEPVVAEKLRRLDGVLVANIVTLNQDIDAAVYARRYMKMPAMLSITDFSQAKPYFLFHLSEKAPQPYKTAFELVFRDAYRETGPAHTRGDVLEPFLAYMARYDLPTPVWLARLIIWESGTDGVIPLIKNLPEKYLFEIAAMFRARLPKLIAPEVRAGLLRRFDAGVRERQDAWGQMNSSLFWSMVPD